MFSTLQHLVDMEQEMLQEETQVPVYFTTETEELSDIYSAIESSANTDSAGSAAEGIILSHLPTTVNKFLQSVVQTAALSLSAFLM